MLSLQIDNHAPISGRGYIIKLNLERCSKMLPVQCKMARVALGLGVRELAAIAKVAPATVSRFEAGEELKERTVEAMQTALEAAGAIFISDDSEGPGVRLRKPLDAAE